MNRVATVLFCAVSATACVAEVDTDTTAQDLDSVGGDGHGEPPDAKVHYIRGHVQPAAAGPNLISHGGPVMTTGAYVEPIFWGPGWSSPGDKITGIQSFYAGMGGSTYDATTSEFGTGSAVTLGPSHTDSSTASGGQTTSKILAEVCKVITNPRSDGYYPVYTDKLRGNAGYCAWHSAGTCNGVTVQFAFFWKLDGDPGCDPGGSYGDNHSQGLGALANVTGHELSETLTDPHLNAWYDSSGAENADKCAWSFGTPLLTFSNGTHWKVQGNWSNNASNANSGYANLSGQKGCIDGGNYR